MRRSIGLDLFNASSWRSLSAQIPRGRVEWEKGRDGRCTGYYAVEGRYVAADCLTAFRLERRGELPILGERPGTTCSLATQNTLPPLLARNQ